MELGKIFKACGFNKVDENLTNDISKIVGWQEVLKEIDVSGVEPMFNTLGEEAQYISNDDSIIKENVDVFTNAPEEEDRFFLVPKVIKN